MATTLMGEVHAANATGFAACAAELVAGGAAAPVVGGVLAGAVAAAVLFSGRKNKDKPKVPKGIKPESD